MNSFRELLKNWEDFDVVEFYLGCTLGIFEYDEKFENFRKNKHIFWTNNPLGDMLAKMLEDMAAEGILEFDREELKLKWNEKYESMV